jgi:hypothetical protein
MSSVRSGDRNSTSRCSNSNVRNDDAVPTIRTLQRNLEATQQGATRMFEHHFEIERLVHETRLRQQEIARRIAQEQFMLGLSESMSLENFLEEPETDVYLYPLYPGFLNIALQSPNVVRSGDRNSTSRSSNSNVSNDDAVPTIRALQRNLEATQQRATRMFEHLFEIERLVHESRLQQQEIASRIAQEPYMLGLSDVYYPHYPGFLNFALQSPNGRSFETASEIGEDDHDDDAMFVDMLFVEGAVE